MTIRALEALVCVWLPVTTSTKKTSSFLLEFVVSIQHRFEQESQMGVGDEMPCDKALQASIVSAHVRMSLSSLSIVPPRRVGCDTRQR